MKIVKMKIILFLIFCHFTSLRVNANSANLELSGDVSSKKLVNQLRYYLDKEKNYHIEQVLDDKLNFLFIKNNKEMLNFGYTSGRLWIKVDLINKDSHNSDYFLKYNYASMQDIEVFILKDGKINNHYRTGKNFPYNSRPVEFHSYLFPLRLPFNQHRTVYLKFETTNALQMPLSIISKNNLIKLIQDEYIGYGAYYGFILILLIYAFFMFITMKDKNYLLYIMYIFSVLLAQLSLHGIAYQYLWPEAVEWNKASTLFFVGCTYSFLAYFTISFLNTKKYARIMHYVLLFYTIFAGLYGVSSFFFYGNIHVRIAGLLSISVPIIVFITGFICIYKKVQSASYFLLGVSFYTVGVFLYGLKDTGVISSSFIAENGIVLGSAFEVALFSLALAHKFRLMENEKKLIELSDQKNGAIAKLTQHLSHDVRKPLSQVRVILDAFDMFKANPSRLAAAKKDVNEAITNIEGMLADVLNYSREVKLITEPQSFIKVLNSTIRQVLMSSLNADILFTYHLNADRKPLLDENRFSRVLANIIGNGIEAITILGKKEHGTIEISTQIYNSKNSVFEIIIGNNGPLFPFGVENKLFDSLFTSGKSSGTGLGLASAKKIVTLHEGQIFARNKEDNSGVEFVIRIPASKELEDFTQEILPAHSKDALAKSDDLKGVEVLLNKIEGQTYKIVLLEDEALYRAWVKNLIQGNEILQRSVVLYDANTVEDAMQLVEKEKPTHAIVDIDLGFEKNGYDFLEIVKSNKNLKTIVHSNRTLEEFRQKAKELGASGFVRKPLPLADLVEFLTGEKIQVEESCKQNNTKILFCCDDSRLIRDHLDFLLGTWKKINLPKLWSIEVRRDFNGPFF